ncbi:hypothetical protein QJS10_CPA06g01097 [Acorus calamus]|uniref:Uncharacterized protein n=1 Tax=Acorus calamus TaxID=4465 RepID=A0AAV9EKA6_ACOCL|nr:hypothetical protein QJS10_CPA06g01097 [Acorus calamus]
MGWIPCGMGRRRICLYVRDNKVLHRVGDRISDFGVLQEFLCASCSETLFLLLPLPKSQETLIEDEEVHRSEGPREAAAMAEGGGGGGAPIKGLIIVLGWAKGELKYLWNYGKQPSHSSSPAIGEA